MWSVGNQLTADEIKMYTKDEVLDKVDLNHRSFIIAEQDSGKYNQIKGKMMTGYIKNNEIYKIDVNGNAQSIYYPMEEEGAIGVITSYSIHYTKLYDLVPTFAKTGSHAFREAATFWSARMVE